MVQLVLQCHLLFSCFLGILSDLMTCIVLFSTQPNERGTTTVQKIQQAWLTHVGMIIVV